MKWAPMIPDLGAAMVGSVLFGTIQTQILKLTPFAGAHAAPEESIDDVTKSQSWYEQQTTKLSNYWKNHQMDL